MAARPGPAPRQHRAVRVTDGSCSGPKASATKPEGHRGSGGSRAPGCWGEAECGERRGAVGGRSLPICIRGSRRGRGRHPNLQRRFQFVRAKPTAAGKQNLSGSREGSGGCLQLPPHVRIRGGSVKGGGGCVRPVGGTRRGGRREISETGQRVKRRRTLLTLAGPGRWTASTHSTHRCCLGDAVTGRGSGAEGLPRGAQGCGNTG